MAEDVKAKAVISVYGDTAPAVKEFNKLNDAQKKLGEGLEKTGGSVAKFIDTAAVGFAKFNLAVGGVQKAFELLNSSMETAFDVQRRQTMEKMLPTGAVDKLSAATEHLISRQDTLRLSVRGMTGEFRINEAQMQKVLQAAVAFSQKGLGPAAEIADKLLDGIAGKTGKLDDLGIAFEKTGTAAGDLTLLFEKMDAAIADPANAVDERTKSLAAVRDNIEQVKLVIDSLTAAVVNAVAAFYKWTEWAEYAGDFFGAPARRAAENAQRMAEQQVANYGQFSVDLERSRDFYSGLETIVASGGTALNRNFASPLGIGQDPGLVGTGRTSGGNGRYASMGGETAAKDAIPVVIVGSEGGISGTLGGELYDPRFQMRPGGALGDASGIDVMPKQSEWWDRQGTYSHGPDLNTSQFRSELGDMLKGDAFSALASGITAAVEAAVSGSEAMGKAAARASAAVLKSLAMEATGRAVFEGAMALGSLAIGDFKDASLHGAAAAKFAIAAGITGSLAAGLGAIAGGASGGGASAPGPAGGGYGSPTGGSSSSGPVNVTVNVGYGFSGDSKQIEDAVRRGVRAAQLKGGRGDNYATQVSG